jgi:hypothetical protein
LPPPLRLPLLSQMLRSPCSTPRARSSPYWLTFLLSTLIRLTAPLLGPSCAQPLNVSCHANVRPPWGFQSEKLRLSREAAAAVDADNWMDLALCALGL